MTHSLILYIQGRPKTLAVYKQKTNLYTNGKHKGQGKALCTLDDVLRETSAVLSS
jgi:hypothetical protein